MPTEIETYLSLITSEHAQAPKYVATVTTTIQPFVDLMNLLGTYIDEYDVDNAVGAQLDVVGQWIGVSRFLKTALPNVFFSFDVAGVGWDEGVWKGEFDPITGISVLDDLHYRILLKARIIANHWDGTIPGAYEAWDALFATEGYKILIQDGTPARINYLVFDGDYFQGWDYGSWAPSDGSDRFKVSGRMGIYMVLIAPFAPPLPGLTYFGWDTEEEETRITESGDLRITESGDLRVTRISLGGIPFSGWDEGWWDVTPEPFAAPTIDALTLALFKGGYLGMKPAGVHIDYVTQSSRGLAVFAFDVDEPNSFLKGWDHGAWGIITPG